MTWDRANILLHKYAEDFLKTEEIHYLAIVKDADSKNEGDYTLQFGVSFQSPEQIFHKPGHIGFQNPAFFSSRFKNADKQKYLGILRNESIEEINVKKVRKIYSQSSIPIAQGNRIKCNDKVNGGTIGAIVKLNNYPNDYFILSNWHVLMNDRTMNHKILDDHENIIAEPFWGIYNNYYDIALAKIISNNNIEESYKTVTVSDYDSITLGTEVEKFEYTGPKRTKKIISSNAFVKVYTNDTKGGYIIYKNQILVEKISTSGDSGSVILNPDNKDLVGLIFAGDDQNITVCNHLHLLMSSKNTIPKYTHNQFSMPEINFKEILINKSFSK